MEDEATKIKASSFEHRDLLTYDDTQPAATKTHLAARSFWHNSWSFFGYNLWANLGGWSNGLSAAVIGGSFAQPSFLAHFDAEHDKNFSGHLSGSVSLFYAGAVFGFFFFSWASDKWGRKKAIMGACLVTLLGGALSAGSAPSFAMFFIARFVCGFGSYPVAMVALVYQSEISPAESRGFFGGSVGFALSCSYSTATWLSVAFYFVHNQSAWRFPFIITFAPPLLMLATAPFVPESPRWLAEKGRLQECRIVCEKIHGVKWDPDHLYADEDYQRITSQAALDASLDRSWSIIFKKRSFRKRALLACLVAMTNQSSGIQALTNFQPTLYSNLGYNNLQQLLLSAGWQTTSAVLDPFMLYLLDKIGRKRMICLGSGFSVLFMSIETGMLAYVRPGSLNLELQQACAAFLFLEMAGYLFGQAACFCFISEIWPTHLRSKGTAIGITALVLTQTWVTAATPFGIASIGWRFNIVFIVLSFIGCALTYIYVPELNQIPLEEIALIFGDDDEVAVVQGIVKNRL